MFVLIVKTKKDKDRMQNVALRQCLSLKTEEPFALCGCGELRRTRKQKTGRGSFLIFQLGPLHGPRRSTAEEKWGGDGGGGGRSRGEEKWVVRGEAQHTY